MDLEKVINFIKFSSHYVMDEVKCLKDEYHFKSSKDRIDLGNEKVRVITKYEIDDGSSLQKSLALKSLVHKFGKQEKNFVDKDLRYKKEDLNKIIWEHFDDVTISGIYLEELIENLPKEMHGIYLKRETYTIIQESPIKYKVLAWLNKE